MNRLNLRQDTLISVLMAGLACACLLIACSMALTTLEREQRRVVSHATENTLHTMTELLQLQRHDSIARIKTIAEDTLHQRLFQGLMHAPRDPQLLAGYDYWISPIYRSRGFAAYALVSPDRKTIVVASSPNYSGRTIRSRAAMDALVLAQNNGFASARPDYLPVAATILGQTAPAGTPVQWTCARVDQQRVLLGYLCLLEDPRQRLYRLLATFRNANNGEAYVVDAAGRILSPVSQFSGQPDTRLFHRFAQVPVAEPGSNTPFTQSVAKMLLGRGGSGVQLGYQDYRGVSVVGAAQWLPDMGMGLVVEEDFAGAFAGYFFARKTVLLLAAVATLLIAGITYIQWRARRRLAMSEGLMAAFRDNIPAGIHLKSLDGRYLMLNPLGESMLKVSAQQAIGKTDAELFPDQPELSRQTEHDAVLQSGNAVVVTHQFPNEHGQLQSFRVVRFPILAFGKSYIAAVGTVAIDITEQVQAQRHLEELAQTLEAKVEARTRELAAARDEAEAAGNAKAAFLANMSHEIRTPLNAIVGMTHLALAQFCTPQVRSYLERVRNAGNHLQDIVNNILDLSRLEAGKQPVDSVAFALADVIDDVRDMVREAADGKGLQLECDIDAAVPRYLHGDVVRIRQVLLNLASNAVKFTHQGGVVLRVHSLHCGEENALLRFAVQDSGVGISAPDLSRLFVPFQQLDNSLARNFEGTGLGLAISKKLVELMGGEVHVSSEQGKGSVFAFDLLLAIAPPPSGHAHAVAVATGKPRAFENMRILLVEDNVVNQELIVELLDPHGLLVFVAENGLQALHLLEQMRFDAVLMDLHLPGMSGLEVVANIRADSRFSGLPIVALTARGLEGDKESCLAAGMDDYLSKPIDPARLLAVLARFGVETGSHQPLGRQAPEHAHALLQRLEACGLDVHKGLHHSGGDIELYRKLLARIFQARDADIAVVRQAVLAADFAGLANLMHVFRANAGSIGAVELAAICGEIEVLADSAGRVTELIKGFVEQFDTLSRDCQLVLSA